MSFMELKKNLNNNRASKANIGLKSKQFYKLLPYFKHDLLKFEQIRLKNDKIGRKSKLRTTEDKLFFTLYYFKTYPTFDVLGSHFGMSKTREELVLGFIIIQEYFIGV